jgi:hypothetical protein
MSTLEAHRELIGGCFPGAGNRRPERPTVNLDAAAPDRGTEEGDRCSTS